MPKIRIYPYKQGSASAKALAEASGGKVLKHVGSKFKPRRGDVVVNWGASVVPDFAPATTLNADVRVAQCKLTTLKALSEAEVSVPNFTEVAPDDVEDFGWPVVCRTKLRGHSGDGIVIANNADEIVDAPLYTAYVKKKDEYRVHVFKGSVIFVQRKAKKLDFENPNWLVRNLAGGFVFAECSVEDVPEDVLNQALKAAEAVEVDFGGVDVIWNEKHQKAFVLEVNTACGLEERTAGKYSEAIHNYVQNQGQAN